MNKFEVIVDRNDAHPKTSVLTREDITWIHDHYIHY